MSLSDVGNLMCLDMDSINPGRGTDALEFLIKASAKVLNEAGGRNWVPVIVKEIGEDQYEVIGNSFIFAVVEEAGLEKVWCIIADFSEHTSQLTKILTGESVPKVNLSTATRDEIQSALQYLIEKPNSELKGVKLAIATNRIDEALRKYWKNLEPITTLKCGITKGKKLNALKEVFYLSPQPMPDVITEVAILDTLTLTQLKDMAKKRGIPGYSKKKKPELVDLLSQKNKPSSD
ncbi:Rho termination factor N-terminal domain-containing protein [Brasilonema sp. CT11]|nr:Rho termination factor N-terminal domain-containing protein [Brasilonema sp. CT11]